MVCAVSFLAITNIIYIKRGKCAIVNKKLLLAKDEFQSTIIFKIYFQQSFSKKVNKITESIYLGHEASKAQVILSALMLITGICYC